MTRLIVLLGAKIMPDGAPSRALSRRTASALAVAQAHPDALIYASGAAMSPGQASEAAVMGDILRAAGVDPERLVLDDLSRDTLQTAVAAARFARSRGISEAIACTDTYHLPRVRLLLSLLGLRSTAGPIASGQSPASA